MPKAIKIFLSNYTANPPDLSIFYSPDFQTNAAISRRSIASDSPFIDANLHSAPPSNNPPPQTITFHCQQKN